MANETNPRNFKRQIVLEKQGNKILVLNNKPEDSKCTIDSVNCQITLSQIEFVNEMYSPAHLTVKATLVRSVQQDSQNVQNNPSLPSYQSIVNFLLLAKASVQNEKSDLLESNFYVHEVRPTYVNNNSGKKVILYLDIYSADKLMTLDKYSKSYVHKSLYEGILAKEAKRFYVGKDENNKYITVSTRDLSSRLKYGETEDGPTNIEIKHPYLVQYNESFYDFLIRTANRTGEFLYFAGGQLTLGVDANVNPTEVGKYNSLAVESRNNSVLSTTGISRNYSLKTDKDKTHEKSSSGLRYTQPTSNDDYLVVYEKDKFDTFKGEYKPDWRLLSLAFKTLLTTSTIGSFVAALFVNLVPDEIAKGLFNSSQANKRYNEQVFKEAPGSNVAVEGKTVFSGTYLGGKYIKKWYANANADFYNKIDECEKKMGSRTVTITLAAQDEKELPNNYQVGQLIEVVGSRYVVTHVKYSEVFDGGGMRYEHIIKALPLLNVKVDESTHKATLLLTDESSTSEQDLLICCPAALPEEKRIRKAASQTAWVVDSDDPQFLGRVRIRYAWDNADVDSPWIRQAEPAAGKGGGVNFRLYKDDEVMIGYENDNIEQPYIIGALYHGEDGGVKNGAPVGRNKNIQNTHVIKNRSGHQMIMSEQDHFTAFVAGMTPTLSYLTPLINSSLATSDDMSELAGGFQFTDRYGIYNVSMSTDQRLISIASPLGNIKLSAFSGITISAPRGDISIVGKNVSIKAANKLSLESGENAKPVDDKLAKFGEKFGEGLVDYAISLTTIDFNVLRHLMEVFLKPVDGTLQIKSHRYLLLEAGKGNALIPEEGFKEVVKNNENKEEFSSFEKYYGSRNKTIKIKSHIKYIKEFISGEFESYDQLLKELTSKKEAFEQIRQRILSILDDGIVKTPLQCYDELSKHLKDREFNYNCLLADRTQEDNGIWQEIRPYANSYFNAMKAMKQALDKGFTKKKSYWASTNWFLDLEFGEALKNAEAKYRSLTQNLYVMPTTPKALVDQRSEYERIKGAHIISQVIFEYLKSLCSKGPVKILVEHDENNPAISRTTVSAPETAMGWVDYLLGLDYANLQGAGNVLGNLFADNIEKKFWKNIAFWDNAKENHNWGNDRAKFGRVLFSDQDDKTYFINAKDGSIENPSNPTIVDVYLAIEDALKADYPNFQLV